MKRRYILRGAVMGIFLLAFSRYENISDEKTPAGIGEVVSKTVTDKEAETGTGDTVTQLVKALLPAARPVNNLDRALPDHLSSNNIICMKRSDPSAVALLTTAAVQSPETKCTTADTTATPDTITSRHRPFNDARFKRVSPQKHNKGDRRNEKKSYYEPCGCSGDSITRTDRV